MVIWTVKPTAVAVVVPNTGVNAAPTTDVCVTFAVPPAYPVRAVVIVAVELVPGATPVMVAKPVLPEPVTTTEPPESDDVPVHV